MRSETPKAQAIRYWWTKATQSLGAARREAEIYNWFTEGFDTKDLQEAKALLEELT